MGRKARMKRKRKEERFFGLTPLGNTIIRKCECGCGAEMKLHMMFEDPTGEFDKRMTDLFEAGMRAKGLTTVCQLADALRVQGEIEKGPVH